MELTQNLLERKTTTTSEHVQKDAHEPTTLIWEEYAGVRICMLG